MFPPLQQSIHKPVDFSHLALEVVEDKDLVVDIELVILDEAGGSGVGPLYLPHVLSQLGPEQAHKICDFVMMKPGIHLLSLTLLEMSSLM